MGLGLVPTEFQLLVDGVVTSPQLRTAIDALMETKRAGVELSRGPRIVSISTYIERELERLEDHRFEQQYERPVAPIAEHNALFKSLLDEVWG